MTIRKFKEHLTPTVPTFYIRPNDPRCKFVPQEKGTGACGMLKSPSMQVTLLQRTGGFRAKIHEAERPIRQNSSRLH
jgi:hypothetical protein